MGNQIRKRQTLNRYKYTSSTKTYIMKLQVITLTYSLLASYTNSTPLQKSSTFRVNRPAAYYRTIQKHKLNPRDFLILPEKLNPLDVGLSRRRRNHSLHRTHHRQQIKNSFLRRRRERATRQLVCRKRCDKTCDRKDSPFGRCKLPKIDETLNYSLCEGVCMLCFNNQVLELNPQSCSVFN